MTELLKFRRPEHLQALSDSDGQRLSKDAGNKITTIMQLEDIVVYRPLFKKLREEGE